MVIGQRLFGFASSMLVMRTRDRPIHFLKPIPIFSQKIFTDVLPVSNILLATDMQKFAYRYFTKYFGSNW